MESVHVPSYPLMAIKLVHVKFGVALDGINFIPVPKTYNYAPAQLFPSGFAVSFTFSSTLRDAWL